MWASSFERTSSRIRPLSTSTVSPTLIVVDQVAVVDVHGADFFRALALGAGLDGEVENLARLELDRHLRSPVRISGPLMSIMTAMSRPAVTRRGGCGG